MNPIRRVLLSTFIMSTFIKKEKNNSPSNLFSRLFGFSQMISPLNWDRRSSCWPMLIVSSKHCLHFKLVSPSSSAVSMKHNPLGSLVDSNRMSAATNWLFSNLIISPTLKNRVKNGGKSIMLLGRLLTAHYLFTFKVVSTYLNTWPFFVDKFTIP